MTREELEKKVRIQSGLLKINLSIQKMARPGDLAEVMQVCLHEANQMGIDACSMALHRILEPEQNLIETFRVGTEGPITTGERRVGRGMTRCWETGQSFGDPDGENKAVQARFEGLPIRCYVNVPFSSGVISAQSLRAHGISFLDEEVLKQIAEIFAVAISRMYELDQLEKKVRLENAYDEVAQTILSSLSLDGVLDNLGVHITQASIFRSLAISLVDYEERQVEFVRNFIRRKVDGTIVKTELGGVGNRYSFDSTDLTVEAACSGELIVVAEYDERFGTSKPVEHYKDQAFYFIPIKKGSKRPK